MKQKQDGREPVDLFFLTDYEQAKQFFHDHIQIIAVGEPQKKGSGKNDD